MTSIYLDYNASTPIDPSVAAVMRPLLEDGYGNPSAQYRAGSVARAAVEGGRAQVASLLGCSTEEVVFTSGGSEASNLAIKGLFFRHFGRTVHIVTSQIEHPAVLEPCRFAERFGATVTYVKVDGTGLVDPDDVRRAIRPNTILISIMHANNEVGTIQPIAAIAAIARAARIPLHTDAAQSVGKVGTNVAELGVDLLSVAGHKFYAPKGVGALYVRRGLELEPLIHGAGQESHRRAGTESALLAAALGRACEVAGEWLGNPGVERVRDLFWARLQAAFGDRVVLNGHPVRRLPNTLNVSFIGQIGSELLGMLPEIAASTGSACHAGGVEPSPVLQAMGVPLEVSTGAIRFSVGRSTTEAEIEEVVRQLRRVIQ
jgi:cysteine desulfurase